MYHLSPTIALPENFVALSKGDSQKVLGDCNVRQPRRGGAILCFPRITVLSCHRPRGTCDLHQGNRCWERGDGLAQGHRGDTQSEASWLSLEGDLQKQRFHWFRQELSGPVFRGFWAPLGSPGRSQRVAALTQVAEATP